MTGRTPTKIFLVGFMGTGKTTLGRVLADSLNWVFHDVDALLEADEGTSIVRIFSDKGEPYFRELERRMIAQLSERSEKAVIAAGGGAYCSSENQKLMDQNGLTVWLDQSFEMIWRRRERLAAGRPLMGTPAARAPEEEVRRLHAERSVWYREAKVRIPIVEEGLSDAAVSLLHELRDRFSIG